MSDGSLRAELEHADPLRRHAALERLAGGDVPFDAVYLDAVTACLALPAKATQRLAADVLRRVDGETRVAVAARLRAALADGDPRLRWGATYALARLGVLEPIMVAPLLEAFGERDGDQRWAAAEIMTACGRVDREAVVSALLAATADAVAERRKMALYALRDVAPEDPAVHAVVIDRLADPAVGVRFAALSAVGRLAPVPAGACDRVLAVIADDPDAGVRRAAVTVLGVVGRDVSAARAALAAAAASSDVGLRRAAQLALRRLDAGLP